MRALARALEDVSFTAPQRRDHLPAWRVGLRQVNLAQSGGGPAAAASKGAIALNGDTLGGAGSLHPRPKRGPVGSGVSGRRVCFRI